MRALWTLLIAAAMVLTMPCLCMAQADDIDVEVEDRSFSMPDELTMRVRVASINPSDPCAITWRHGGEGLGGDVINGSFSDVMPVGQWSNSASVKSLVTGKFPKKLFLTVVVGTAGKKTRAQPKTAAKDVAVEFEFSYKGKVVKTFSEAAPDGTTVGIVIPAYLLAGGKTPEDTGFLHELTGLLDYAKARAERLEKLPWANWLTPRKFAFPETLGGYGEGSGRGIRQSNKAITELECRSLRQLGINGFRGGSDDLMSMISGNADFSKNFSIGYMGHATGYPSPCPSAPGAITGNKAAVDQAVADTLATKAQEVWALTVDEIGPAIRKTPEGATHMLTCPFCQSAFREYLKKQGLTPADFGRTDWFEIKPVLGNPDAPKKAPKGSAGKGGKAAKPVAKAPASAPASQSAAAIRTTLADRGTALMAYYTTIFTCVSSAEEFTPLRDAFDQANQAKQKAIADGKLDSPQAKQPWIYSYALRTNTFLMGGAALDFFEFYRHADNGFVYETSNREARIWSWDSYLCDVGRVVSSQMKTQLGVYVKPHRGAPVQRGLSAISRGARMIHWYTYGPDYFKGDSFSQNPAALELTSKAAHIIGKAEDVLYNSSWVVPAEVAVVTPQSSHAWMGLDRSPAREAAWENAKWTYTALTHAHIPVDPIDEVMLATSDLARYKAIYISGPNLTKAAATKLEQWVKAGGVLYTSGGGLARDEANQPLTALDGVLGLGRRTAPQMYYQVALYGATGIEPYDDPRRVLAAVPDGAEIVGAGAMKGKFKPIVGREVLEPTGPTQVLAKFADGGAAMTCNAYGKGKAYVVGFFPGLEYSSGVRNEEYNMTTGFSADKRDFVAAPALTCAQPVVDASQPAIEGVLLKNSSNSKRAVTLMNWAYQVSGVRKTDAKRVSKVVTHCPAENVQIIIRGAGNVTKVTSTWLDKALEFKQSGATITVALPKLEEGDVLVLE